MSSRTDADTDHAAVGGLTREELLRRAAVGGGAILVGGSLAGTAHGATGALEAAGPKRGGTFRIGVSGGSAKDFIDGQNKYGAEMLYRRFRQRKQVWRFGLNPDEVSAFVAEYGWRLVGQAGPDYYVCQYIQHTGRNLTASQLEWTAYAVRA